MKKNILYLVNNFKLMGIKWKIKWKFLILQFVATSDNSTKKLMKDQFREMKTIVGEDIEFLTTKTFILTIIWIISKNSMIDNYHQKRILL